mgnify:CR=1 FL=1
MSQLSLCQLMCQVLKAPILFEDHVIVGELGPHEEDVLPALPLSGRQAEFMTPHTSITQGAGTFTASCALFFFPQDRRIPSHTRTTHSSTNSPLTPTCTMMKLTHPEFHTHSMTCPHQTQEHKDTHILYRSHIHYTCMHTYAHTHTHMYTHTYTHTHTHTHTHTQAIHEKERIRSEIQRGDAGHARG